MSFTPASLVSDPISSTSCHFFCNHSKESEGQGEVIQRPSFAFNNMCSATHQHICMTSNPSPVLRSRSVSSSLSFDHGTMNQPIIHNHGSTVTRAASFQSKLNPSICSLLPRPGSDNDSLHSSTSSLEYSSGGLYLFPTNKMAPFHGPLPQREYQGTYLQHPQVESNIKKFLHGNVFKSEINQKQGMVLNIKEPQEGNHDYLSNLDFQIPIEEGVGMQRGGGADRFSPGKKSIDDNANWNGLRNVSSFREDGRKKIVQQVSQVVNTAKPRTKEIPRLNKFPLDLDSLVIPTSSATKVEVASTISDITKVSSPILGGIHSPPSTASTSASLSSLDSSSNAPCQPFNSTHFPLSPCSPVPSHGSIPVPETSCSSLPLSPSDSFQLEILPESEVVCVSPSLHSPSSFSKTSSSRAIGLAEDDKYHTGDSVELILQRIASFSWPAPADTQTPVVQFTQSNGGSSNEFGGPLETTSWTVWRAGEKKHGGNVCFKFCFKTFTCILMIGKRDDLVTGFNVY